MSYYWCAECGEPCEAIEIVDEFDYEYWGATGTHKETYEVSDCCEADLIDDEEERDNLFANQCQGEATGVNIHPSDQQTNQGESK